MSDGERGYKKLYHEVIDDLVSLLGEKTEELGAVAKIENRNFDDLKKGYQLIGKATMLDEVICFMKEKERARK